MNSAATAADLIAKVSVGRCARVSYLTHAGTRYEADCWMAGNGQANGSVRYDTDRAWFTIQGRPAALRKLAEALVRCAELTEQTYPAPAPVEAAS